jgi:hypothetical protein
MTTLEKINKTDNEKLTGSDIKKIDDNATKIENTLNNLPTGSGSTVTTSTTNGNIKIDGVESKVYTAPTYTKSDVGLGNVDNTSDLNKPISTAMQTALNLKATVVALTATEYSAITTPVATTLYLIKA